MKHKYSVNKNNQLVIKPLKAKRASVTKGYFATDNHNRLIYWLNAPSAWRKVYDLPNKIVFEGSWQLNKNYDLELVLDKNEKQADSDTLVIKGKIISADSDILAFEVKSYNEEGLLSVRILKLYVTWLTDRTNRLSFIVKKHLPDIIALEGEWQVNKYQQITYTYERTELKRKTKTTNTLVFQGYWQIASKNVLVYRLLRSLESRFDFSAEIASPNLYPQQGVIKYRIGIGLKGLSPKGTVPKTKQKIIYLYGAWKFSRRAGLSFEMDYGEGGVRQIGFTSDISLTPKNKISFALNNAEGEPLGLNITFTHRFLNNLDSEAYLRLNRLLREEVSLEGGVRIPF